MLEVVGRRWLATTVAEELTEGSLLRLTMGIGAGDEVSLSLLLSRCENVISSACRTLGVDPHGAALIGAAGMLAVDEIELDMELLASSACSVVSPMTVHEEKRRSVEARYRLGLQEFVKQI